ncbi:MAG: chemotaxis protein [Micavibrio aeruginosavorus]|uniref:Chemotaxis protein n=1 Tax=Micavibrio aeruginosavorus TaxID=349221 RepID=A0A2W4ZWB7_9BACT|nr:MAG: chemotaxis protein [Micavibrio aeruginosavorus]
MRADVFLSGKEADFSGDEIIVSKTDIHGKLIYGNRTFYRLAGLSEKECIGKPHNIIRHPEMPKCVFRLLWSTIKEGKELFAYVNNRSSNGDNYWVFAHVTPSYDSGGNVVGYHSNRRVPNRKVLNERIIPLYSELLSIEATHVGAQESIDASMRRINGMLKDSNMTFNQLMFSMGV